MVSASIEQLLILQDRDGRCDNIRKQLAQIPLERAAVEKQIEEQRQHLAEAEAELTALIARGKQLEGDVEEAGSRMVKYKTQQMLVKRNEEYQALEHEIGNLKEQISSLEDAQLELFEAIDMKRAANQTLGEETASQVALFEKRLQALTAAEEDNQGQLDEAAEAVDTARTGTGKEALQLYDFVKSQVRRAPVLCPINEGKCSGCRLRVSGSVETETRRGDSLTRCDSCGRILYWEP